MQNLGPVAGSTIFCTGFTDEACGTPRVNRTIHPHGFTDEVCGTPLIRVIIHPSGFTDETCGTPTVTGGVANIFPVGIMSGEFFGNCRVFKISEQQPVQVVGDTDLPGTFIAMGPNAKFIKVMFLWGKVLKEQFASAKKVKVDINKVEHRLTHKRKPQFALKRLEGRHGKIYYIQE